MRKPPTDFALESQIADALAAPWWIMRFKTELEARYDQDIVRARILHIMITGAIGGLFVMLYLISDRLMIPDIYRQSVILRGVANPLVVGFGLVCISRTRSVAIAEGIVATFGVLVVLAIIYLTVETHSPYRDEYLTGTFLSILYVNIVCQARFGYALVSTICCLFAVGAALVLIGGIALPIKLSMAAINITTGALTLVANFQIERQARRQYLMNLREQRRNEDLASNNLALQTLSEEDPLTGVYNRRALDRRIYELFDSCQLRQSPISVIMIDVDHFKAYNDNFGHAMGDRCLQAIAAILIDETRGRSDLVARYGGEEFIIVMPNADLARVALLAERLRAAIETRAISAPRSSDGVGPEFVTASFGIATYTHMADSGEVTGPCDAAALIHRADESLYAAKAAGRNRVYGAQVNL